jgi:hypothetical protein
VDTGFEAYEPGSLPLLPGRFYQGKNCRIEVTNRAAAKGEQSLAFIDGQDERSYLPHWAVRFPESPKGAITVSCDLMNDAKQPARFRLEFRDWSSGSWHGGPTVTVQSDGSVQAGGKNIGTARPGQWAHLEIRFASGPKVPRTFSLTLVDADGQRTSLSDLPMPDEQFSACTWFGISSLGNEPARYYLDNLHLAIENH